MNKNAPAPTITHKTRLFKACKTRRSGLTMHNACKGMYKAWPFTEVRCTCACHGKESAKAGVCPCCNRSFSNLRRHIQAKHKEF